MEKNKVLVRGNSGREIYIEDAGLYGIAIGLDERLIEYGDIKDVDGVASIIIRQGKGQLEIEVDQQCEFKGNYNHNSGVMTKRGCELALKACLFSDLSWVLLPNEEKTDVIDGSPVDLNTLYPKLKKDKDSARYCANEYYKVKDLISQLPQSEAQAVYEFLD